MNKGPIFIATLEYPPQHGGIATYLSTLAHALPEGSVQVLAPKQGDTHDADVREHMAIYRRRLLTSWLRPRWLTALFWTNWLTAKEKPSMLVVSHLLPMGTVARLMKQWHGTPYTVILHGMDIANALDAGGRKLAEAKRVLAGATQVVVNSAFTMRLAESAGVSRNRLMLVHPAPTLKPGITYSSAQNAVTREHHGLGRSFLILSVGRLVERKGFDTVIEAVAVLRRKKRDVRLAIAGSGPDRQRLEELCWKAGVAEDVQFLGAVPSEELSALYSTADLFCLVPRSIGPDVEGFGIVYLDAGLMGKPVIASQTGGVPEAVIDGETGLLVPPTDVPALVAAISRMMDDPSFAARLGMQGRQRAEKSFNPVLLTKPLVDFLMQEKP